MSITQAINIAAAASTADADQGRMDSVETVGQIGRMNVAAISGGRVHAADNAIVLPVSNGYHVVVSLTAADTYNVRQVFVRSGKATIKGEWTDVYCDEVGEAAYQASCFR
jgi:hypothetical protein